ncbi:carboxymuconolactone decarboxylase family protein [Kitasatospora sp. NPDC127111]|uniref:carboxymuconolactone decarboxylase family protein n=1 Tax=Kitasatospora sp. NPDC127111 TaxID=3345363 RepID=UPI0036439EEA
MSTTSETPVLDTLMAMTADSIERCGLAPDMLILSRIAALVAMDAPPVSYLAHLEPAMREHMTASQLQDVLVAIAPIVGTARVMSAAAHITEALGIAIAVAEDEAARMGGR